MRANPLFTPRSGRITLSLLAVVALLMALIMPAFIVGGTQRALAQDGNPSETGTISVFKTLVDEIGQQDTPMRRDTSLAGFEIDFLVFAGETNTGTPVDTITVTLGENANGEGNIGDGSEGRATSIELPVGTFTVCEVEVARGPNGEEVLLDAEPRPEASNGGSTGGQQEQTFENCITVEITAGNAELQFLDEQVEEEPTEIPDNQQEEPNGEEPEASPMPDGKSPDNQQDDKDTDTDTDTGTGDDKQVDEDTGMGAGDDKQEELPTTGGAPVGGIFSLFGMAAAAVAGMGLFTVWRRA